MSLKILQHATLITQRDHAPERQRARLLSVDALRGAAALGVVLYHTVGPKAQFGPTVLRWMAAPFLEMIRFGYVGVFLFFVISGFCIHLSRARAQSQHNPAANFRAFWKRRIRRLYPPYLIALTLYLLIAGFTTKFEATLIYVWDVFLHLLMLHNLDSRTVYSINGVFWTLAIEEQLYFAYFLLLFLRNRWGWARTLLACLVARVLWFIASTAIHQQLNVDIPITEAAASHWFTWALGAISVEAMYGLVRLPAWCYRMRLALVTLLASVGLTYLLPVVEGHNRVLHDVLWLFLHPLWGSGFFILLNCFVAAEKGWRNRFRAPTVIRYLAVIGVFSYSLYLTHELVVMEAYQFGFLGFSELATGIFITTPLTIAFAWVFFRFAEKPYVNIQASRPEPARVVPDAVVVVDT